jgi:hypothetical protein
VDAGGAAHDRNPGDDPLPGLLRERLIALLPQEILDFAVTAVVVRDSAYLWLLWGAADLIEGGCSDDGFRDFRDGLILQGREVFSRTVANPDSLVELPIVRAMADGDGWLGFESLSYLPLHAWRERAGTDDAFHAAMDLRLAELSRPTAPVGASWDFEDDAATARHLPRLAALFQES